MADKLIRFDWAIKKLLRSKANFGILEGFLSELLKVDIKIVNILESEGNKETKDDKYNKVDILVQNDKEEVILIEVQVTTEYDFLSRLLYGSAKVITEYMKEGDSYKDVRKVYSIGIVYFDLGQGEDYAYHGTTNLVGLHLNDELQLDEKQKLIYKKEYVKEIFPEFYIIKVNQFNDVAKDTLDEWIYFLKNEEIKDEFKAKGLSEAKEKLRTMKLPEKDRNEYKSYLEDLHYQASLVESSYGLGQIIGRLEGKLEVARNLLDIMGDESIAQKTGISIEEIRKLRNG